MPFDLSALVRDYGAPFAEAEACRRAAALFDFSFVARGRIAGPRALETLARLVARRLDDMTPGQIRYAVRISDAGVLEADLTVWRHPGDVFEVMSGRREDIAELVRIAPPGSAADLSDETAIFAVQGPRSLAVLQALGANEAKLRNLAYYRFASFDLGDADVLVGRLGYTGEAGFELVVPRSSARELWSRLAALACPAGFAAADILRIEAGFVLFAHEFRLPVTVAEAGLEAFARSTATSQGDPVTLVAFTGDAETRPVLWQPPAQLFRPRRGELTVTSACWSPHLGRVLGLGYMAAVDIGPAAEVGARTTIVDPTGTFGALRCVRRPPIDPAKRRPRAPWAV